MRTRSPPNTKKNFVRNILPDKTGDKKTLRVQYPAVADARMFTIERHVRLSNYEDRIKFDSYEKELREMKVVKTNSSVPSSFTTY